MIFKMIKNSFTHYITHHVDPAMGKLGEGEEWRKSKKQVADVLSLLGSEKLRIVDKIKLRHEKNPTQ